ncbi:SPFH domain-containing protein [Glaciihabitans tibetensis]|uniref:SPFH domain-containing protein n=1 Tax=Glaciihabitans tibetensis TaxID=1266600 RepID=A0A2T0VJ26_9MICO|nr:prohibitin family protein [Glaciihabitans tibetensis]PRY70095.1 SPFH domain-containing protein [Glaciihabitans tibetensis]
MLFAAIIFLVLALIALLVARGYKSTSPTGERTKKTSVVATWVSASLALIAVTFAAFASFYTQDAGTAVVEKDITGNIVGQSNSTGLHGKAPWVNTVEFSIRNQQVVFAGTSDNDSDNNGGVANGAQITVQDADGVSSNIDIALRYSIAPDSVTDIYKEFLSEENFKKSFIEQDVRSVVRLVPNQFSTLDLLTKRGEVEAAVLEALEDRWSDDGVIVDSISLQEIRVPDAVKESYAAAQQAQINVTKETANLEAAQVSAQQKVVQAQAEADANAILNGSLTENILSQRYLDTLKELAAAGNLVVVPEGFNGLVNVTK